MIYEFAFPDVGEGVHEGKILELTHKPGDELKAGDIIAVVETDKVVAEIPSSKDGILDHYGAEVGAEIRVGETLAYIRIEGDSPREENAGVVGELELAGDDVLPAGDEAELASSGGKETGAEQAGRSPLPHASDKVQASPVARKMASDLNIDLSQISGSGPMGRIMKADIKKAAESAVTRPASAVRTSSSQRKATPPQSTAEDFTLIPFDTMRRTIAVNMEASQRIPTAVVQDYSIIDRLAEMRRDLNEKRENRLSFQPFFIKALALALQDFPAMNATFDAEKGEIKQWNNINIGLAVDTVRGLMVPVIRNVMNLSIEDINAEMKSLVEAAKNGRIELAHLRGGTFSLTNYGPFGGVYGKPMIAAPQVAIMGFGRIHEAPVSEKGQLRSALILPMSLSFDHRVVDGAFAAKFVSAVMHYLSKPHEMLVRI